MVFMIRSLTETTKSSVMRRLCCVAVPATLCWSLSRAADKRTVARMPCDGNPRTVYLSTGDNQDVLEFAPLDSEATVKATFDAFQRYRVHRIWWRADKTRSGGISLLSARKIGSFGGFGNGGRTTSTAKQS